jgi:Fe-S cluster biosynthesis and repair protein YggX
MMRMEKKILKECMTMRVTTWEKRIKKLINSKNLKKMNKKHIITLGSDPEVFIEKDGEIVSAIGMIPGSKNKPHPITDEGHFIQTDNIAFEFNIPPCETEDKFVHHINYVKDYLEVIAISNGCKLSTLSSSEINPIHLDHPQAQEFGCEPDFNPYTCSINERPDSNTNLRCVGGHVHIGYPDPSQETSEKIIKAFDIFVTMPALLIDKDERRRELYGKAGAFRFKDPWGVEARALSNFWIHNDQLIRWVYKATIRAVECVLDGEIDQLLEKYSKDVVKAINTNNKKLAKKLISEIFKEEQILIN